MKKLVLALSILCLATICVARTPKYVFYFIGDGMGPSHILGTELYLGEQAGVIGRPNKLNLTQMPYTAFVTTYSASNGVTDSAASGTALATGNKTNNKALGVTPDGNAVFSIAAAAKEAGYAVGLSSTCPINHATPGAFYAHQNSRNNYSEIAKEMLVAGYDFYAGGDPVCSDKERTELYKKATEEGYSIVRGYNDFKNKKTSANKIMLYQEEIATEIPYTIDRSETDLTLAQITEAGIDFLEHKSKKGFFFMIEGGKIDYASHSDDAATMIQEVLDFDRAIAIALEFYKKHKDETLIIVTADHETGGLVLGFNAGYTLNLKALAGQRVSADKMSEILIEAANDNTLDWNGAKELFREYFGLWEEAKIEKSYEQILNDLFTTAMQQNDATHRNNSLKECVKIAKLAIANDAAISWASGNHSGTFVPLFAIGCGAEEFHGVIDNTDIPKIIERIAKY